jgi:hypothetical protein
MESAPVKPKRKILKTVIAGILIGTAVLWVAGAIVTELSVNRDFSNTPESKDHTAILQEVGYDLSHPLGFIKNLQNNPIEPDIIVSSTYTENVNQANQAALNQLVDKKYSYTDYPPPDTSFTISETMFQAANNGTTVPDSQLSSLLGNAVKPFKESTLTADVSLLFPIKNPGDQIITVDKIANTLRGGNFDGVIGPEVAINWETILTVPNKGSEIIMPLDAKVYRIAPSGVDLIDTALICFAGSDGTNYELLISEEGDVGYLPFSLDSILPALADVPEIDYPTYTDFSDDAGGKTLSAGTPILKTINNNAKINFWLRCEKKVAQPDFNFISSEGKLIYSP